jgi:hypothetical protein
MRRDRCWPIATVSRSPPDTTTDVVAYYAWCLAQVDIHAESDEARASYVHLLPELLRSPTDEFHLVLLMKDARRTLLG